MKVLVNSDGDVLTSGGKAIKSGGGGGGNYNIVQTVNGNNCSIAITDQDVFVLQDKTVTTNGQHTADAQYSGLGTVTVNVPPTPTQSKNMVLGAAAPATVNPDSGYDLSSVVPQIDSSVIKAENIAAGVQMLGITGTHQGGGEPASILAYGIPQSGNSAYATNGSTTVQGVWTTVGQNSGFLISPIYEFGEWTVHAVRDGVDRTATVLVGSAQMYEVNTYSRLPSGYTEVEYIESSGTQYIDTGLSGLTLRSCEIDLALTDLNGIKSFYGAGDSSRRNYIGFTLPESQHTLIGYGSGSSYNYYNFTPTLNTRMLIKADYNTKYFSIFQNGSYALNSSITNSLTNERPSTNLLLLAVNFAGTAANITAGKLYGTKIYDGVELTSLSRNFIPCHNSSNVIGMYDLVSNTFFTNAGTGVFVAGPDVN